MTVTYPLLANALMAGVLLGGFYAALSVGATIAFGLLDIVNIAHPTFAVIGAYAVLTLNRYLHVDPLIGGLLLTPVFYAAGALLYRAYHYFFERHGEDAMRGLAFFFGMMFIAEVVLIILFGVDFRYVQAPYITTTLNFGALAVPLRLAVPFVGSLLLLLVLELFLRKTFIGRAFAICVFGGLGSLPGTLIAALSLGLIENLATIFIGASWSPAVAFGVLLATLAWRPAGLFGRG